MKPFFILLMMLMSVLLNAQEQRNLPLFLAMKKQDSLLFERGYNQCNMKYLESITHKQFNAYYERGDAQSREKFFADVLKYHCEDATKKQVRKVNSGSLEVFALYEKEVLYGAVQSGSIELYLQKAGAPDIKTGTAQFTHIWLLEKGKWLLKEAMSFGHVEVKN